MLTDWDVIDDVEAEFLDVEQFSIRLIIHWNCRILDSDPWIHMGHISSMPLNPS